MNSTGFQGEVVPPLGLEHVFSWLTLASTHLQAAFTSIPGSAIIVRYVKNSHQNDPWRTLLELCLFAFAVRTVLSSRTRTDRSPKNFVELTDKEIDELVVDWTPEPLVVEQPPTSPDANLLGTLPVILGSVGPRVKLASNPNKSVINMTSYNFTGMAENEKMKETALTTLRDYGVGSCGPPGFWGTNDVHTALEQDLAAFLQLPSAIIYAQAFTCITSVIPSFAKRGDIIVADRACNFAIQRGLQISRSTIRFYEHGDMSSLEQVLESVTREAARKKSKLTRRFIVTEGLFENDGFISDLEKLVELKNKYKFRLILDESYSFGTLGDTGRGLTELCGVPAKEVDMLIGSMANTLGAGGGFCAGSTVVTGHQRINSAAFVFSASLPPMIATTASTAIRILQSSPQLFVTLRQHGKLLRLTLDKLEGIHIPSHALSPLVHVQLSGPAPVDMAGIEREEIILQEIVEEALNASGILLTRTRRLRGQETFEARPSIKIALSSSLTKKDMDKAVGGIKAAIVKVLGKKR
ncbi:serine palmitoyltransferase [Phaffia rhodozyma]|uniref:serine C-palmitoyltransferase n=1 Tax=Phaffia rhodozyma TaxID=264483 RepID=A0A0F7SQL4_PHARH|nr:serine palmitoyltransferase [Phaffia rhodozyma]